MEVKLYKENVTWAYDTSKTKTTITCSTRTMIWKYFLKQKAHAKIQTQDYRIQYLQCAQLKNVHSKLKLSLVFSWTDSF